MQFRDEFFFLSNFYPAEIKLFGIVYPTLEHAYQSMKFNDVQIRMKIQACETPGKAKRLASKFQIRDGFDDMKIYIMTQLIGLKFRHPELRKKLLATGNLPLIEENWWHDEFWGVCNGKGQNILGKLLMAERERIRKNEGR